MGKLSLVNLVVGILILIAVIVSYLGIMSAIGGIAGGPVQQAAPRHTITISGVGNRVTNTTGGTKECDPLGSNIQAEASISGGSANNEIKATAKCSLSIPLLVSRDVMSCVIEYPPIEVQSTN